MDYRTISPSGGLSKVVNIDGLTDWFHLAAVIDPTTKKIHIYVNGNEMGAAVTATSTDKATRFKTGQVQQLWFHTK